MTASLPPHPSLENLKKQAKTLKNAWQEGDARALNRIRAIHPQYANAMDDRLRAVKPKLADCQLVLARELGFDNWRDLKAAVASANRESAKKESANEDLPHQFVTIACLCHDDPHYDHRSFHAQAHAMLRENPWLAESNIWSAATAGNSAAVRTFLDDDPSLVNRPGPHGWAPLICACYSRVDPVDPSHSTFESAKFLLDRGADPNAFTLKGNADDRLDQTPRRFTALAGLFGGGSTGLANQPPHPRWRELAELLLERGANPADEMALALNQDACLEMLLAHGLKPDAIAHDGVTLLGRALIQAIRRGRVDHVRRLLARHARTDEKFNGKIPWEHAMRLGCLEVARFLEESGATVSKLDDTGRFVSLCMASDEPGARAMLASSPDLLSRAPKDMVQRAVSTKRAGAVKLALDLGFDSNWMEDNGAIHQAGTLAENEEILRILLDRGASLTLRDPWYDSTGIGWADFFNFIELRDRLLNEPGISLFDALDYNRVDRVPDILARDPEALNRPFAECISREPKPEDWTTPLVRMVHRGNTEAVRVLLECGADIAASHPSGQTLVELAREKGFQEIAGLLEHAASE